MADSKRRRPRSRPNGPTQISVRGETHRALKERCDQEGVPIANKLSELINTHLDLAEEVQAAESRTANELVAEMAMTWPNGKAE